MTGYHLPIAIIGAGFSGTLAALHLLDRLPARTLLNALVTRLIARGLVRVDRHRLGLDVSPGLEAIGRLGAVTPGLWALGPLVRGVFWECTAVPEIRVQAAELAGRIEAVFGNPDLARAS